MSKKEPFIATLLKGRYSLFRAWYKFSRNPLSIVGLIIFFLIVSAAIFAPFITPYPEHAEPYTNFSDSSKPPSLTYFFGTDGVGRDIFTLIIFGYRFSLILVIIVISLSCPFGVALGLIGGYYQRTWIGIIIMRITDVFIALPPLVLALAIAAMLNPSLINQMVAISFVWWTWYCRLTYAITTSLCQENFVHEVKLSGASDMHIIFREIFPHCINSIFMKITLDIGWIMKIGASLSFIGLGAQPPKADLGSMVADGARRLPNEWWASLFPVIALVLIIVVCNFIGDGLRDMFVVREV